MYKEKYSLLNDITMVRSCSGVPRGCANRICLWRGDDSIVLIGAGGARRSDWPADVLANDVSTIIDQYSARDRSTACVYVQVAASYYKPR